MGEAVTPTIRRGDGGVRSRVDAAQLAAALLNLVVGSASDATATDRRRDQHRGRAGDPSCGRGPGHRAGRLCPQLRSATPGRACRRRFWPGYSSRSLRPRPRSARARAWAWPRSTASCASAAAGSRHRQRRGARRTTVAPHLPATDAPGRRRLDRGRRAPFRPLRRACGSPVGRGRRGGAVRSQRRRPAPRPAGLRGDYRRGRGPPRSRDAGAGRVVRSPDVRTSSCPAASAGDLARSASAHRPNDMAAIPLTTGYAGERMDAVRRPDSALAGCCASRSTRTSWPRSSRRYWPTVRAPQPGPQGVAGDR
ncbi:hypothetical protein ACRAWD_25865 [Caulobacter segnis]